MKLRSFCCVALAVSWVGCSAGDEATVAPHGAGGAGGAGAHDAGTTDGGGGQGGSTDGGGGGAADGGGGKDGEPSDATAEDPVLPDAGPDGAGGADADDGGASDASDDADDGGGDAGDDADDGAASDSGGGVDASPDVAPPAGDVRAVITADNAYSFGYGTVNGLATFIQGSRAMTAGQIFNCPLDEGPEAYTIPAASAPPGAYLYIVSWDDLMVTQGVIAQFERDGATLYTGDPAFDVCATGLDYSNSSTGPTQAVIDAEITKCNAGSGAAATTSRGWVNSAGAVTAGAVGKLAVGEANDAQVGTFPLVCQKDPSTQEPGISAQAHWMWYDPLDGKPGDAFHSTGTNRFKAFLIFRLRAADIKY